MALKITDREMGWQCWGWKDASCSEKKPSRFAKK